MTDDSSTAEGSASLPSWLTLRKIRIIVTVYALAWVVYGVAVALLSVWLSKDLARGGQFGDMFGAFNALVSGLAMLGVTAAILLQRDQNVMQAKELRLQRRELKTTRRELAGQRQALEAQTRLAEKDYVERNKPVVFCDRREHEELADNFHYVMRNVGGGFAVNVYFLSSDDEMPLALGSLPPHGERKLPIAINKLLVDADDGLRHIVIAEGAVSRTTQWTPTLNYRSARNDVRKGQVQHRVARVTKPGPRGEHQQLRVFLSANRDALFAQLRGLGTSEE